MPARPLTKRGDSDAIQQQSPFTTTDHGSETDVSGAHTIPRSRARAISTASNTFLSSSYTQRAPPRSFAHQASHPAIDPPQYSSQGVRERTQELASYALDSGSYQSPDRRTSFDDSDAGSFKRSHSHSVDGYERGGRTSLDSTGTGTIAEDIEEGSEAAPESFWSRDPAKASGPRHTPPRVGESSRPTSAVPSVVVEDADPYAQTESTPLLPKPRLSRIESRSRPKPADESSRDIPRSRKIGKWAEGKYAAGQKHIARVGRQLRNPKLYTRETAVAATFKSLQTLSAVFLGLLLNILDALSYGYILFPLGVKMFSQTGPDGISIFFVSCIVSQLCYSLGLSMFRGGVGSEMIEVVPFFHNMAYSIMAKMEGKSEEAIMATVIVSYCLSSVVTGLIFLGLGGFKLGNLVSFFPRHILIGCIGGVGFFLVVTGIEVSARLEGNLNYDLETLHKLFAPDTVYLWILPLVLAVIVIVLRRLNKSPFVLPGFFIAVFAIFYIIVKGILRKDLDSLRSAGWIFEAPEAGVPFYRFYSYFKFKSVDYGALFSTLPTMLALSFFGIIHVPINVPALGAAAKEDHVDVNRELIAHGVSNTLSGCVGSIQNYLVYANSVLFMENGGDNRPAGVLLAAATGAVWMAGPAMIGFIPVCLVGALIFLLGIELLEEALWDTFGKCHKLEYITIIAIVLIMGVYDFVVGIFAGIVLACLSYVVLSSRTPAVRATYSGDMAESTVRRPRADRRYLSRVRSQIRVIKLTGFLFFGTIVSVEAYMRSLIEEDKFQEDLTSFIIVDFAHVTDVDFSSSEGFLRINRILARKHVKMIISGISFSSKVGLALQNVGLFDVEKSDEDCPPPRVYEDLNMALEACENELLESFYIHQRGGQGSKRIPTPPKAIAESSSPVSAEGGEDTSLHVNPLDPQWQSPRRGARYLAAETTMREQNGAHPTLPALSMPSSSSSSPSQTPLQLPSAAAPAIVGKWKNISQPLKIILQTFEGVSSQGIDFWHLAAPSFERVELKKGTVLYHRGEMPDGFYVLESGRFRAEYEVGATNAANNNNKSKEQGHGHRSSNDTFGTTSSSTSTSPKRHMRKSKHTVNPRDAPHASFYETILPGTTCGELPFFSETPRTGTVIVEEDSVAWKLSTEKFLELERREPAVGRELVRVGLRLTKERLDGVVGFVYGVVGGGGA